MVEEGEAVELCSVFWRSVGRVWGRGIVGVVLRAFGRSVALEAKASNSVERNGEQR